MTRDDEALQEVFQEIRRNQALKQSIMRASQSQDFENAAFIVNRVLASLGRTVDNFVNFVNDIIAWFRHS